MKAAIVAELAGNRTRCSTLRSVPPISLRATPDGVYLVASGAGPLGGDHLELDVDVRPGASLTVRSAAASMVLPGPSGDPSSLRIDARVGGELRWEPEPTILADGCDHHVTTRIDLAVGASVAWREVVVLGRHHEPSGSLLQRLHVDRGGAPLLRTDVPLGPRWPGSGGSAGTNGAIAVASTLVVGLDRPHVPEGFDGAVLQLADDAWLVSALRAAAPPASGTGPGAGGAAHRDAPSPTR